MQLRNSYFIKWVIMGNCFSKNNIDCHGGEEYNLGKEKVFQL